MRNWKRLNIDNIVIVHINMFNPPLGLADAIPTRHAYLTREGYCIGVVAIEPFAPTGIYVLDQLHIRIKELE